MVTLTKTKNIGKLNDNYINGGGKDIAIRVRIKQKDKDLFYETCDEESLNPSEVVRMLIKKWCNEHQN